MSDKNIICGIDVGTTKIVVVIAEFDESGAYSIIGIGESKSNGLKRGVIVNIKDTIKSLAIHEKDVGSTEIQIGLLTDKIIKLSEHFKKFKKDKHSTLGLTKSVNKRKKLLTYLKKKNVESYQKVIKQLNLRK